jgi:hypothetical protein
VPGGEEAVLNVEIVPQASTEMAPRQRACVALCMYLGREKLRMTACDTPFPPMSPLPLPAAQRGPPRRQVD